MSLLTKKEIQNLHSKYADVVNYINHQNHELPIGQKIKQVQLPSSLTESIAYYFIINNPSIIGLDKISPNNLTEGNNRTYDLIYEKENKLINIEVKATGTSTFQRFRQHALTADFAIWINFNTDIYDIAVFSPKILTPSRSSEITITWDTLLQLEGILLIKKIRL